MSTRRQLLAAVALAAAGCSPAASSLPRNRASPDSRTPAPTGDRTPAPSGRAGTAHALGPPTTRSGALPGGGAEISHGSRAVSAVALTFHGAGDTSIARAVLRELAHGGVKVTVLAVGKWLGQNPEMARLILDSGHELGNHTQNHRPMRGLSAAQVRAEIEGCAAELRRLTGTRGRWFRASGTQHTTPTIRAAARQSGYAQCLSYDVDSLDWTDPGPRAVLSAVLRGSRPGSILSFHLGHEDTVRALPAVLAGLRRNGLAPGTVGELLS